jgi:alpha/beta superfamily hydrolase
VEGSAGEHDHGIGEVDDALAALDHLQKLHGELSLAIAGHSFGAWVGLRAAGVRPEVERGVAAGLPVAVYDFAFLRQIRRPLLVVQGDRDNFGPEETLKAAAGSWSEQVELAVISGADHFFTEHLPQLHQAVVGFLHGS